MAEAKMCENCIHDEVCYLQEVCNEADEIENACEDYKEKRHGEWISVKDRLPEKKGRYLICDHKGNIHILNHCNFYASPFGVSETNEWYFGVTHWMPLPEPPGGER